MKTWKKFIAGLMLAGLVLVPVGVFGAADDDDDDFETQEAPTLSVETAINNVTNWTFVFVLTIAVLFLIFAGFQFITAGGDPEKLNKARSSLFYGAIGVGVAVMARGLVSFVRGLLGE
jgi:hypothetical protein